MLDGVVESVLSLNEPTVIIIILQGLALLYCGYYIVYNYRKDDLADKLEKDHNAQDAKLDDIIEYLVAAEVSKTKILDIMQKMLADQTALVKLVDRMVTAEDNAKQIQLELLKQKNEAK